MYNKSRMPTCLAAFAIWQLCVERFGAGNIVIALISDSVIGGNLLMPTLERLELPMPVYRSLEQIAQIQGVSLADAVGNLVRQYHREDHVFELREEYQLLADKELLRRITEEESQRIEIVARQLSAIEMESKSSQIWEQQSSKMNALLDELKSTLSAYPDKTEITA